MPTRDGRFVLLDDDEVSFCNAADVFYDFQNGMALFVKDSDIQYEDVVVLNECDDEVDMQHLCLNLTSDTIRNIALGQNSCPKNRLFIKSYMIDPKSIDRLKSDQSDNEDKHLSDDLASILFRLGVEDVLREGQISSMDLDSIKVYDAQTVLKYIELFGRVHIDESSLEKNFRPAKLNRIFLTFSKKYLFFFICHCEHFSLCLVKNPRYLQYCQYFYYSY